MKLFFLVLTALSHISNSQGSGDVHYDYDPASLHGPDLWHNLHYEDGTENQCGGHKNSPINIQEHACDTFQDYIFDSGDCMIGDFAFLLNHHAEQGNAPPPSTCQPGRMRIPGVEGEFELLQFHFHTSSEHTLNDKNFGGELHMVHKQVGGDRLAVMGVFLTPSATVPDPIMNGILSNFDSFADEAHHSCNISSPYHWWQEEIEVDIKKLQSIQMNVYDLIPEGATFYNYDGGLTTPPCSEIVEWSVADKPLAITVAQYNDFVNLMLTYVDHETCEYGTVANPATGSTSRPVQPLNGRTVQRICPVGYQEQKETVGVVSSLSADDAAFPAGQTHAMTAFVVLSTLALFVV
mmetsp:Transcript_19321/g.36081  ORF Transcript_19321/g.36081 Transcript_19321/m.36081 type:complete len:350 (+) Transcript_19321:222-1271(+)